MLAPERRRRQQFVLLVRAPISNPEKHVMNPKVPNSAAVRWHPSGAAPGRAAPLTGESSKHPIRYFNGENSARLLTMFSPVTWFLGRFQRRYSNRALHHDQDMGARLDSHLAALADRNN